MEVSNIARSPVSALLVGRVARGALAGLRRQDLRHISVALVTPKTMRRLNRTHRDIDLPTDVLSFSLGHSGSHAADGEVILCYPYLKAQAKRMKIPIREEVSRMLIHGILHLAGYDHEKRQDAAVMFPLQERLLKKL